MPPTNKRLLILDDDVGICEILKRTFKDTPLDLEIANDIKEAFRKISLHAPDCILLDIRLADGDDGLTFLRHLRSYRDEDPSKQAQIRKIPVVVLTATGEGMRAIFEVEGISAFFEKPYDSKELKSKVLEIAG